MGRRAPPDRVLLAIDLAAVVADEERRALERRRRHTEFVDMRDRRRQRVGVGVGLVSEDGAPVAGHGSGVREGGRGEQRVW